MFQTGIETEKHCGDKGQTSKTEFLVNEYRKMIFLSLPLLET